MNDFECHITIEPAEESPQTWHYEAIKIRIEALKWSYSCIYADPVLGQKSYCYATNHYEAESVAISMTQAVANVLRDMGLNVVRMKVEHVVYDVRRKS